MDKEYYDSLAKVRLDRAKELLEEAVGLLERDSYKSANNRAFYAMETVHSHRKIIKRSQVLNKFATHLIMMIFMLPLRKRRNN
ncbi:MAG: hypothetical protein NC079_06705 [Clostridium sp.]|nr:hypothetical protein [Acetatifactor muris]MCM1526919.1 hypothetical protein [Bacteroides sp.]MCM1563287.1 hypothetical protein [Clostridium sp.]